MRRRGFTLVEVLVALTLLAVGVLVLLQTPILVGRLYLQSQAQVVAYRLAQAKLWELEALSYDQLSSGSDQVGVEPLSFSRSWSVQEVSVSGASAKRVVVSVDYQGVTGARTVSVSSLVSRLH